MASWVVDHAHDHVARDIVVLDLGGGVVLEHRERPLDARDVLRRVVDEQVDVLGEAARAVSDHGEAADQEVAGSGRFECPADPDDVFRLRRACVSVIVFSSHASASSNDENRTTPRGARADVPLSIPAVRARRPWSRQASLPFARRPRVSTCSV